MCVLAETVEGFARTCEGEVGERVGGIFEKLSLLFKSENIVEKERVELEDEVLFPEKEREGSGRIKLSNKWEGSEEERKSKSAEFELECLGLVGASGKSKSINFPVLVEAEELRRTPEVKFMFSS